MKNSALAKIRPMRYGNDTAPPIKLNDGRAKIRPMRYGNNDLTFLVGAFIVLK